MSSLDDCITPEGFRKLKDEERALWQDERPRVTAEVSAAAALGDRSENAEYQYGKRRLREIDRRLQFLRKRMAKVQIVRPDPSPPETIGFCARVTLEDEAGQRHVWKIVGTDEFDVSAGKISVASPLARALLGKRVDDEVDVRRPRGPMTFTVLAVDYGSRTAGP